MSLSLPITIALSCMFVVLVSYFFLVMIEGTVQTLKKVILPGLGIALIIVLTYTYSTVSLKETVLKLPQILTEMWR